MVYHTSFTHVAYSIFCEIRKEIKNQSYAEAA